ncbi:MAG: hypothetical protein NC337_01375 [Roseburia sp.]|nr:hypothetical protein [Roseburia sp.]
MKNKILTLLCTLMMAVPFTLLPLRTFDWALQSPTAEIMIYTYMAFMLFSGVFTIVCYTKIKVRTPLMKVCLVVNGLYFVAALAMIGMTTRLQELLR